MKNAKNKSTTILLTIIIAAAAILYKNFLMPTNENVLESNILASTNIEDALEKVGAINFDMSVFNDPKLDTFKSIETTLPSISKGRKNPFTSVLGR